MQIRKIISSIIAILMIATVGTELNAQKGNNSKSGIASYYHNKFVGRKTANGEIFSNNSYTAACNKYPLGTYLKVTNNKNNKVVFVKVNDRIGHPKRIIDLTHRAAKDLNFVNSGLTNVTVEVVDGSVGKQRIIAQTNGDFIDDNIL
ncbi:MAG TPA: septal ring lytic transglycosylase RlpA family protein [Edaphocola sp.]|nr:septal ring lytic transglycosylase RlpA family protein [Edaphocola sp.]